MKKLSKLCALALLVVMSLSLVACANTYPNIKKAFEKEGYKQSETVEGLARDFKSVTNKDGKEIAVTAHALVKNGNTAFILEFKATDEMIDYYKNNEVVRNAVKDVTSDEDAQAFYNALKEKGYANGNCMLVPVSITGNTQEMRDIMKKA